MATLFLVCALVCFFSFASSKISIENGAYNIEVAIHKNVEESRELISNIQNSFYHASVYLHEATDHRLYFKSITIGIPSHWNLSALTTSATNSPVIFKDASFRITPGNPIHSGRPFTVHHGECGQSGEYVHMTDEFFKDRNGKTREVYGDIGKLILHEFAHYRFGVFDEAPEEDDNPKQFPRFYLENGEFFPTLCMKGIKGVIKNRKTLEPCSVNLKGKVNTDCEFYPYLNQTSVHASIMGFSFISSITKFCNESTQFQHNRLAPTKQNYFCDSKSTGEVISNHPDMIQNWIPRDFERPVFNIVQLAPDTKVPIVLVLDVSNSMNANKGNRLKLLKEAAARFVDDIIQDGDEVGIVLFSSKAIELSPIRKVDYNWRKLVSNGIRNLLTQKGTSIGAALIKAVKAMNIHSRNRNIAGNHVILITDGIETVEPYVKAVQQKVIISKKVKVSVISIGNATDTNAEDLTKITGGNYNYVPENENYHSSKIDDFLRAAVVSGLDEDVQPIEIVGKNSKQIILSEPLRPVTEKVVIDRTLGKNTVFIITGDYVEFVDIAVISPRNKVYNSKSPEYNADLEFKKRILLNIPVAEPGTWTVMFTLIDEGPAFVHLNAITEPRFKKSSADPPIKTRAWTSLDTTKSALKIFADVKKGFEPVLNASVQAMIESDHGISRRWLRDDGYDPDIIPNDGIYSSYYELRNSKPGRYSVSATVSNKVGKAIIARSHRTIGGRYTIPYYPRAPVIPEAQRNGTLIIKPEEAKASFPPSDFIIKEDDEDEDEELDELYSSPAEEFERSVEAGAVRIDQEFNSPIPPGRITDLQVTKVDGRKIGLSWTNVGEDLNQGTANFTELRFSDIGLHLKEKFNSTELVTDLHKGSLKPLEAGKKQEVEVILPEKFQHSEVYFAIRVHDNEGQISDVSNVVGGFLQLKKQLEDLKLKQEQSKTPEDYEEELLKKKVKLVDFQIKTENLKSVKMSLKNAQSSRKIDSQ